MPEAAFVLSRRQHHPLRELAATVGYELGLQAVPFSVHLDGFPEMRPDRVYVLLDPRGYVAAEGADALPDDAILKRTIFLCAESPPAATADDHLNLLRRAGAVFVLDQRSVIAMHRLGIPARLMRPGYSASLDRFDPDAPRGIDVMFLGAHSLRRTRYLRQAARVLARHTCLLQIAEDVPAAGDTSSFLGEGRWPLLAQTKVLINLHRGDEERFEWRRALDAIHAGAVVVTEHSSGITPLVPGEHLLVAGPDSLPFVADALLRDEQRLVRLRSQAYERLSEWIPYALPVSVLRAAIVELVGEPVPAGASLGTPASVGVAKGPPAETAAVSARLGDEAEAAPAAGNRVAGVTVAYESPAWAALRAPSVSAVTARAGSEESIVAMLDSVARGRSRDVELIVVVGTGPGEATRRMVATWMADHPAVAARMVGTTADLGAGPSRNIGLDFARGRYCLVIDAGQELYPRCLDVLTSRLDVMPETAFVYPVQEVTGDPEAFADAGGDHLMSFLGWDRRRLRQGNHVHAPALIRTDRLRAVGGYATDPRLVGFEDYDLWCRLAERGFPGDLVREVLARRSESGTSAVLRAMHPGAGSAEAALTERAPTLLAGAFGAVSGG